jgi:hypothetical protein
MRVGVPDLGLIGIENPLNFAIALLIGKSKHEKDRGNEMTYGGIDYEIWVYSPQQEVE